MAKLAMIWAAIRDSLWFIPTVLTFLAAIVAVFLTEYERTNPGSSGWLRHWVFEGSAEGARGVLSAIAGGLITVTGVVFSVTIVALQLASSQFTPRVLRTYTADRANQLVLGVFIATFTYALLVLRTVGSAGNQQDAFVPRLAVTIAIGLVVVSIGCLIYFIDHSAKSIQISSILERVVQRTMQDIDRVFPEQIQLPGIIGLEEPRASGANAVAITAARAGYLQAVDGQRLFDLGHKNDYVIYMECRVGDFLLPGDTLATVEGQQQPKLSESSADWIRSAFVLGHERTPEQDVEFGIIEISDIAVKALSPGINDPTTAMRCIDRLVEVLYALGYRQPQAPIATRGGKVHFIAKHISFERAIDVAFHQIRRFATSNAIVSARLIMSLEHLATRLPPPLASHGIAHARAVMEDASRLLDSEADRTIINAAIVKSRMDERNQS